MSNAPENTPSQVISAQASAVKGGPQFIPLAFVWVVVLFGVGAVVCSWLVVEFGQLGGIGLWAVGGLGGLVARKLTRVPSAAVAWALVAVCVLLLPIAEVSWIHWKTKQGANLSWFECFSLLPVFVQEYRISAFLGAIFTFFGAQSAYWQAGKRYRLVAVDE